MIAISALVFALNFGRSNHAGGLLDANRLREEKESTTPEGRSAVAEAQGFVENGAHGVRLRGTCQAVSNGPSK